MDKQIDIATQWNILFNHKKEWSADTCYNVDQPPKCHMLYDYIYIKYLEYINPESQNSYWAAARGKGQMEKWLSG